MTTAVRQMALAVLCCAACGLLRAQTAAAPAALSKAISRPPIKARLLLRVGDKDGVLSSEVTLLGRDANVLLAQDNQSGTGMSRVDKTRVVRCEFTLDFDRSAVGAALRNNDWAAAVRTLAPTIRLALPYLDLADNNGFDLAMDYGMYMVASADRELRTSTNETSRARAQAIRGGVRGLQLCRESRLDAPRPGRRPQGLPRPDRPRQEPPGLRPLR